MLNIIPPGGVTVNKKPLRRPEYIPPTKENIPEDLKTIPQWVLWRAKLIPGHMKNGEWVEPKWTKPLYSINGRNASSTDPRTWAPFEKAWDSYTRGNFDGVGLVLTADTGIVGVDLDDCVKNKIITPEAQEVVNLLDSYTEISPSGEGLRVFCQGTLPFTGRNKDGVEMYGSLRYLTMTGAVVRKSPVAPRQAEVDVLSKKIFGLDLHKEHQHPYIEGAPDAEWWDGKIENLPVPDRIKNLITGALHEKDRSTDMMAVINHLAYCRLSDSQIYQIFAENPIGDKSREKNDPEKWLKSQIDNGRGFAAAELGFYTTPQEDFGTPVAPAGPSEDYFTKISVRERPPEIPWVFNDLLPRGAVGFVAAVGGTGKSYLLLELAMRSVFGLSSFEAFHPVKPLKVFVVMVEDPEVITLGRIYDIASTLPGSMEVVEAALDERFRLRCVPIGTLAAFNRGNPSATKAHQELKLQIEAFNPDLIILDPKSQLYGLDENNNDHNTFWVNLLKDLIDKIRALLFAHHMPKMGSAFDVAGARGGSALADASRLVIGIEHLSEKLVTDFGIDDSTQYAHMRFTKCSYAPLPNGDVFLKRTETGRLERCYPQNLSCHIIVNLLCEALGCHYADGGAHLTERNITKDPPGKKIRDTIKEDYPRATADKIAEAILTGINLGKLMVKDVAKGPNVAKIIMLKTLAED